jgi:hypothetical protein
MLQAPRSVCDGEEGEQNQSVISEADSSSENQSNVTITGTYSLF